MSPRLRHLPQGGNTKKPFPLLEMAYEMVCSCFRNCGDCGDCGDCGFCWGSGHALGATRSSVSRTSTPQATRGPASFRTCSNPSSSWSSGSSASGSCYRSLDSSVLRSSGFSAFCPWFPVPRSLGPLGSPVYLRTGTWPQVICGPPSLRCTPWRGAPSSDAPSE